MGKKPLLLLSWAMLLGIACSDEVTVTETPQSPWVTPSTAQVGPAAGSYTFELREADGLSVTSDQTWCTPEIKGGEILASYTQNDLNATRTAVLTVKRPGTALPIATLALVQSRASISLADDRRTIPLKAAAEAVSVDVLCDVKWTADSQADWIELTPGKGKLLITPTQNPTGQPRKGRITLNAGAITDTFTVEQEGAVLTTDSPAIDLFAVANTRTISIASNVVWEATSNASWLTAANTEGKLILSPTANGGATRTTEVLLTAGTLRKAIKVSQRSVYESMLGTWTVNGQVVVTNEGHTSLIDKAYKVTLLEDSAEVSYLLNGFGTDYLATTTEAPVTMAFDASTKGVSITMGEEIGVFSFMNFTQDPENKALVKSVYMTRSGDTVTPGLKGGEILTGSISEDLNTVTFETGKGMGFGMWVNSTGAWSGFYCSYRMVDITLTREIALESPATDRTTNRFIHGL